MEVLLSGPWITGIKMELRLDNHLPEVDTDDREGPPFWGERGWSFCARELQGGTELQLLLQLEI